MSEERITATSIMAKQAARADFRRHRADRLASDIMQAVYDAGIDGDHDAIHRAIFGVLYESGAYVLTDQDRDELGLEPRDKEGWTPTEAENRARALLDLMNAPIRPAARGIELLMAAEKQGRSFKDFIAEDAGDV